MQLPINGRFSEIGDWEEKVTYVSSVNLSELYLERIFPISDGSDEFQENERDSDMKIGYARVSTQEQDLALQIAALAKEGLEKISQEKPPDVQWDRPELKSALAYMRKGGTLVVWELDRLARSMEQLFETIELFQDSSSKPTDEVKPIYLLGNCELIHQGIDDLDSALSVTASLE